jgi:NADH-quinone oxidoreductase subunit D
VTTTHEMEFKTEPFVLNMGPAHPSTHGVFRIRATLDGEVVLDIEPVFGYLHRGIEKLMEERTYTGCIPLTDRLDYVNAMSNNFAYCRAVEKLAGIKVPERAEYIRVITAELQRIGNHCIAVGAWFNDAGALGTPFFYLWREREKIYDLLEMLCGQRLMHNYVRIGGVSQDMPAEFLPAVAKLVDQVKRFLDEFEIFVKQNEIILARGKGVGILSPEMAINCGISGPVARASGIKRDLRKDDPYSIYDRFDFDIPTCDTGDCYDRYRVRIAEMRQSLRIIEQAMKDFPSGPVKAGVPHLVHPPAGEAYARIESPKGELGVYVVSDNSIAPYRCHIRPPSLINLAALRQMVRGWKVADLIVIFGSIDITMGEVDR